MVRLLNSQGMKNFKCTESIYYSILTIYTNDWSTFWHVYCCHAYFFSARFLNMCKPRTKLYLLWRAGPPGLVFYGTGLAHLPNWLGWLIQAGSVLCDQKFFLQKKFITFPLNRLPFYLGSSLHIISSLLSHFYLFQNAILHKMFKLGLWNFKPIFLRMKFSFVETFFSLVLVICLSWYLHLKLSNEFLTFISFNIWR